MPISDPLAHHHNAVAKGWREIADRQHVYFAPFSNIEEATPQMTLGRGEPVDFPPLLIMQGGIDDNVLLALQKKFSASYRPLLANVNPRFLGPAITCGSWISGLKPIVATKCSKRSFRDSSWFCNKRPKHI